MWSYKRTIYRGIPLRYKDYPLTVSAMREKEIQFMEATFIENFGREELEKYRRLINVSTRIPFFANVKELAAWAWFLSLTHILVEIHNNMSLIEPLQYSMVITMFENMAKVKKEDITQRAYQSTSTIFMENREMDYFAKQAWSNTEVSAVVYGLEYFQHQNYDIRKNLDYNPFPTMVMDWTEDIEVAKEFAEPDGIILSIDYDKYKQLICKKWYPFILDAGIAAITPGMTPYFDYHSIFSQNNVNMQRQKGVVLFWPWDYTISELEKNKLGRRLGFKVCSGKQ